jgi:hypothetical protein
MKRAFLLGIAWAAILCFVAVGVGFSQGRVERPKRRAVEASGPALWEHMKKVDYAKRWKMWPGKGALYKGEEPHGVLLTTYVNGPAQRGIGGKKGVMPNGAIVVKENYSPEKKLIALTVMYKTKGYNPAAGDWFWARYSPDGKVEAEGKVEGCMKCHGQKKSNDFLFTGNLK